MAREFIDREKQFPPDTRTRAGDQLRTQGAVDAMRAAPRGEPPKNYDVRSVYDSRPVQGIDFNIAVNVPSLDATSSVFIAEFEVPSGYVAVLRELHHSFSPPPLSTSRSDVKATLRLNGQNVQYNQDIPVGIESDGLVTAFVIADEFNTLGVKIDATGATGAQNSTLHAHFYGNFLLKTGIPKNFEIANPTNKQFTKVSIPAQQPVRPPIQAPTAQLPAPMPAVAPTPVYTPPPQQMAPTPAPVIHRSLRSASNLGSTPVFDQRGRLIGYR